MNNVKYILALLFVVICLFVTLLDVYSENVVENLSESVIRLHVVANSNSPEDQSLKLKVRDNIIAYLEQHVDTYPVNESDIRIAENFVLNNIDAINRVAQETIENSGYKYETCSSYGEFYFPVKQYENFVLPSGVYTALKVEIGQSTGENWWCVLYPPLCFPEGSFGEMSNDNMEMFLNSISDKNSSVIILSESQQPNIKFKIVELFQKMKKRKLKLRCENN